MRAQDLKIGGFGTLFRRGAIGTHRFTQKVHKCMEIWENAKYWKSQTLQNHVFWLNEAHMGAQDLTIGGFGTEFRAEAIGVGLRTQKYTKNMEKNV